MRTGDYLPILHYKDGKCRTLFNERMDGIGIVPKPSLSNTKNKFQSMRHGKRISADLPIPSAMCVHP